MMVNNTKDIYQFPLYHLSIIMISLLFIRIVSMESENNKNVFTNDLPIPPPPPPMPPPPQEQSYQYFLKRKHLAMLNGQEQYGSSQEQMEKKYKNLFDRVQEGAKESQKTDPMINITLYTHCKRCDRWILKDQQRIHMSCHAAIIREWLLLGDRFCSMSPKQLIERNKVKYIVNAANQLSNFLKDQDPEIQFLKLSLLDDMVQDPIPQLIKAAQFLSNQCVIIEKVHDKGGKVFVHCNVGKSRSVSVILVYFLIYEHIAIDQGLIIVKEQRSIAQPNPNYMKRLKELEQSLKKQKI